MERNSKGGGRVAESLDPHGDQTNSGKRKMNGGPKSTGGCGNLQKIHTKKEKY